MPLQLRVLATGQLLEIPNEGQTIGREGGQAEVQLPDNGLSGRHARIFADGSEWLIQDLGSSNGTLVGGVKIDATTPIQLDDIITMGATKFEVAKMWDAQVQQTMMVAAPVFDTVPTGTPAVQRRTAAPSAKPSAPRPAPAATVPEQPAVEEQEPSMAPTMLGGLAAMDPALIGVPQPELEAKVKRPEPKSKKTPAAKAPEDEAPAESSGAEADAAIPPDDAAALGQGGIKYFLVAVPKAIAFYLAAIPLLLVNPIGYVRKGIAEQKHEAMGKMQLIAYALPALFVSAFLPAFAAGIALLVRGTFSLMSFIPIVPAISAVIGAVVAGYLFHPVMKWIIEKLKGSSDEKSRTNYFLMLMTATAVLAVPTAVSTLLTLVPVPFIGLVGVLISIVASLASVFILYSWLVFFDVMKVVRTVVLVLGGLGALGSLYGGVMAQVAIIRGMGSSGGSGVAATGDAADAIAKAQKDAEEAMEKAKEAQEKGEEAVADAKEKVEGAVKEAKAEGKKVEKAEKTEKAEKVAAAEPGEKPTAAVEAPAASVTYPEYVKMRDAVDKAINDDPALLTNRPELVPLYKEYTNATFEVDSKFKALDAKNPADAKLNAKLRDGELFQKTQKAIVALHTKIKPGPAPKGAPAAKEEKAAPAPAAKEEKKAEAKPAPAAKEEKKAEAKPAPAAKEEKKAEAKPAPAAKEEKKAEAKPAPAAKEEKKPAGKGKFACSSKPGGAEIWVDGKNTGKKTPINPSSPIELAAGKHTVLFKLNGKSSAAQEINVEPGGQVTLKGVEIPGA